MVWISVFVDAICPIMQKPAGTSSAADNRNERDSENRIRQTPNPVADRAIRRSRP
jgi:hypothetical protein